MNRLLAANALLCLLITCPLFAQPVPALPFEPITESACFEKHRKRAASNDLGGSAPVQEVWVARGQQNGPTRYDITVLNRPRLALPTQQVNSRCGSVAPNALSVKARLNLSISSQTTALHAETGFLPAALNDRPRDRWLGFDKVQHLTVSFLWTLGTQYTLVNKASLREGQALPFSIGSSAVAGIGKEYYDLKRGNRRHFSRRDLVADAVGILLAAGLILL